MITRYSALASAWLAVPLAALLVAGCNGSPAGPSGPPPQTYAVPVVVAQLDPTNSMKIWPFGIAGGDHPNGHPGIDFFVVTGGDVLADSRGTVAEVTSSVYPGEMSIGVRHGDGWKSFYTGFFQSIKVAAGQSVAAGQVLATAAPFGLGSTGPASYHWGIIAEDTRQAACPADFLSPDDRARLQALLDQSSYPDKDRYPLLCNPCPPGGCR